MTEAPARPRVPRQKNTAITAVGFEVERSSVDSWRDRARDRFAGAGGVWQGSRSPPGPSLARLKRPGYVVPLRRVAMIAPRLPGEIHDSTPDPRLRLRTRPGSRT